MKRRIIVAALLILAGLSSLWFKAEAEQVRAGFAMNTIINMRVYASNDDVLDDAYKLLAELDNMLSMYNPNSEISRINSLAGNEKFSASPEVIEVVEAGKKLYDFTHGIFNPLIGSVTQLWKINRADGKIPTPESLDIAIKLSDINNLEIDDDNHNIFLKREGCILDLGGIAKGYASEKIADMLKAKGVKSGIIDLGGNVYTIGKNPDGQNWRIGVRNPLEPTGSPALVLNVNDCAVITSGNYERYKIVDGKKYSHFFDTKTGESIMSDLLSVTLVTPDGSLADGLATAFMISGVDEGKKIYENLPDKPGLIFITQNEIIASENLINIITRANQEIKFF